MPHQQLPEQSVASRGREVTTSGAVLPVRIADPTREEKRFRVQTSRPPLSRGVTAPPDQAERALSQTESSLRIRTVVARGSFAESDHLRF